jgi:ABC-type sulfate transport system substrate-binding protein
MDNINLNEEECIVEFKALYCCQTYEAQSNHIHRFINSKKVTFKKLYINAKMVTVETVSGIWRRVMKNSGGGGEFKYDRFDTL